MKIELIEKAIEEFKNKRLYVYKADLDQTVRDTRVAERATKDHIGRWLFELLQNSDDAEASEVMIFINNDTIYVADNGRGLQPTAVSAICGTDFSDKTSGTIGRKGVGFKSVYEVTQNPQVLTIDEGGIEFSLEKTKSWLCENGLTKDRVPYQWVPFFISWGDAQLQDPHLKVLKDKSFKTVVKLPGLFPEAMKKVEQLLKTWPPHALFNFRHLRQITAPGIEVVLRKSDSVWSLYDSRGQTPVEWRVAKRTESLPGELLDMLDSDERKAVTGGISYLIAAPLENDCVVPTSDYLPVHVFYPTEQKCPVRLLLHAEFIVKSDRTALIPIDDNPLNAWVADRLAVYVCKFVNDSYCPEAPSSHIAVLVPFPDRTSHSVADNLWGRVADEAKQCLRLADVEACQRLSLEEARLVSVSVRPDLARTLLEFTSIRRRLLHHSFDNDKEARKALKKLGCKEIHDQELVAAIAENADSLADNTQWVWACWQWLADWVAKEPHREEQRQRIERMGSLPIVPVNGSLVKASDLADRIVTWRSDTDVSILPGWLPLTFVEDWFRDRIQNEIEQEYSVKELSKKLAIVEPGEDAIQRAVGRSIEQYWGNKQGDPGRFLRFILEQDWHETTEVSSKLRRCPVPLSQSVQGEKWTEAGNAYFGREWGNELLADLYEGLDDVAWVANDGTVAGDCTIRSSVLEWLGVVHYPRVLKSHQDSKVWHLPEGCQQWKKYLDTARDYCERQVEKIAAVSHMDHLTMDSLEADRGALLIILLSQNWNTYYRNYSEVCVWGRRSRERNYRSWQVKAKWWWEVCEKLPISKRNKGEDHTALTKLWLPDKRTDRVIGDLLPVVDVERLGNDKETVGKWLINVVGLRTQIEQLTVEEWKTLLSTHIPAIASIERLLSEERLRDKVTGWYAACLDTVVEQENISEKVFSSCPLICRRGDVWQYVVHEPRYLDDDNDLATAFAKDVWLFDIPHRLADNAGRYFDVKRLSQSVEVNVTPGEHLSPLQNDYNVRFSESLPYVWAWRSSQSKQDAERLPVLLKRLNVLVVNTLEALLSLDGLCKIIERQWHINDHTIYLHKDHVNETSLAQALAKAIDVRSEADFYENLLRCNGDHQRKEKLLSKGIADAEIDRCLRKYSASPSEEELEETPTSPIKEEQVRSISQTHSNGDNQEKQPKHSTAPQPSETLEESSSGSPANGKEVLRLKDPNTTPYTLGTPPKVFLGIVGSGGGGGMEYERQTLTDEEKVKLEEAGRTLATRELTSMGFSVEKMLQDNPGFDLRAKKDGNEFRIEVKAHCGRATVVDVTQREYKEYLHQQGYRWELWNVENLAENESFSVIITRYEQIPDDALYARTFRVDLKRCLKKIQS